MVSMSSLRRGFILGYTLPSILVRAIIKKTKSQNTQFAYLWNSHFGIDMAHNRDIGANRLLQNKGIAGNRSL